MRDCLSLRYPRTSALLRAKRKRGVGVLVDLHARARMEPRGVTDFRAWRWFYSLHECYLLGDRAVVSAGTARLSGQSAGRPRTVSRCLVCI